MIDERTRAALARLTDNEKACLIRRLSHQTAKEMAIELGVSPHAVEKRLKMARTKLGLSSSLEAAQLLAASEGYGRSVPQGSYLAEAGSGGQEETAPAASKITCRRAMPFILMGALPMSLAIAALLSFASQLAPSAQPQEQSLITTTGEWQKKNGIEDTPSKMVKVPPETVRAFLRESFDSFDKDHSGFLERPEAPASGFAIGTTAFKGPIPKLSERPPHPDKNQRILVISGPQGQAAWLANWDNDADGRVSWAEYEAANFERFLAWGVPANWRGTPKSAAH